MKKFIFLFLTTISFTSFSQTRRVYEHFSFSYGVANKVHAPSFTYTQTITFGRENSYHLGTGLRFNGFYTKKREFEGIETRINKVTIAPMQRFGANSLNIPVIAEFHTKKFLVGINFDLIGFTFGRSKDSLTVKNYSVGRLDSLSINPIGGSFQLFGKSSRGTLNSELYAGYNLSDEITIRGGVAMMRSGFKATYVPQSNKETTLGRFTMNQLMPFISIVLNIER